MLPVIASAIDRDAVSIDAVELYASSPGDVDALEIILWSEQTLANNCNNWAVLVSTSGGVESPTGEEKDRQFWQVGLGLKYYLDALTSLAVRGTYGQYHNLSGDPDFRRCTVEAKRRLSDAMNTISPFIVVFYSLADGEVYENVQHTLGFRVGSDFMLTDRLALSLQGGYEQSEGDMDGFLFSVGLICYWNKL
jgi:hypothetical protein